MLSAHPERAGSVETVTPPETLLWRWTGTVGGVRQRTANGICATAPA